MCLPWVEFIVSFVHAAECIRALRDLNRFPRHIRGLWTYFTTDEAPSSKRSTIAVILCGKSGRIEPQSALWTEEAQRVEEPGDESKDLFIKKG